MMKHAYQIEGKLRNNIGDVLQGMVAKDFLPREAIVADRENLSALSSEGAVYLIANGWYMHDFSGFPPPPNVVPLYISMHIADSALLLDPKVRSHLTDNSPIGCRDRKTLQLLRAWGIPAYYSGCLTVTSRRRDAPAGEVARIILVDNVDHPVPADVFEQITKKFGDVTRISHDPPEVIGELLDYAAKAEAHMENLLNLYCLAELVITTKIHCALPCIGMGAEVILIHPDPGDPRLATVREFLPITSYEQIRNGSLPSRGGSNPTALARRKQFLHRIMEDGIRRCVNPVSHPNSLEFVWLNISCRISTRLWCVALRLVYILGLKRTQLSKVYAP